VTLKKFLPLVIALLCGTLAHARNVDLSTVPKRDSVQLTIYNSEDLTLVRETRTVTFKKGANPLQFSWANTLIDPTSVQLKFLTQADKLDVLDTTFPHDKPQMLYWNVASEFDGPATIEITYFTSGISWSADYTAIADRDETRLALEGFVKVRNNSGEEYDDAQIRLVVGTINLVEKIAELARIPMKDVAGMNPKSLHFSRISALQNSVTIQAGATLNVPTSQPKQIIKQGLSEYFIYTIEGTESIKTGWSKRMRSFEAQAVPVKIQYRYRPAEYGDRLVRLYLLTNDAPSKLGTTPLPDGVVRVFRDNGRGGLSYLTGQAIKYVPIGDKIELNLGPDPSVTFELVKRRAYRDEVWLQFHGTDVFRRIGGGVQIDVNASVVGWDDHEIYAQRVRNYTPKPIEVEIRRPFPGHVTFRSQLKPALHDFQTVQFTAPVGAGQKAEFEFEVVRHQGRNSKQNNVTLDAGPVAP
jgi:hypothetical protein